MLCARCGEYSIGSVLKDRWPFAHVCSGFFKSNNARLRKGLFFRGRHPDCRKRADCPLLPPALFGRMPLASQTEEGQHRQQAMDKAG